MPPKLATADEYEAYQVGNQVIVIARIRRQTPSSIVYLEGARTGPKLIELSLLTDPSIEVVPGSQRELVAFREFESKDLIPQLKIQEHNRNQIIEVKKRDEGFLKGGTTFDLPIISVKDTLEQAINSMKSSDHRAVLVEYSVGEHDLFMNYQIARGFTDRSTFSAMRTLGHPVRLWGGSGPRMGLFSMTRTSVAAMAKVTSAFESVGGGVAGANKVCLCSTNKPQHTVLDQVPTLDQQPCKKMPLGHGTYRCF